LAVLLFEIVICCANSLAPALQIARQIKLDGNSIGTRTSGRTRQCYIMLPCAPAA